MTRPTRFDRIPSYAQAWIVAVCLSLAQAFAEGQGWTDESKGTWIAIFALWLAIRERRKRVVGNEIGERDGL